MPVKFRNICITKFNDPIDQDHLGQGNTIPDLVVYLLVGNEICPKT